MHYLHAEFNLSNLSSFNWMYMLLLMYTYMHTLIRERGYFPLPVLYLEVVELFLFRLQKATFEQRQNTENSRLQ